MAHRVLITRRVTDEESVQFELSSDDPNALRDETDKTLALLRAHRDAHNKAVIEVYEQKLGDLDRRIEVRGQRLRDLESEIEAGELKLRDVTNRRERRQLRATS